MQSAPKSRLETFAVIEAVANRLEESPPLLRRRWSAEAKARILEEALAPGANVSAVARAHDVSPQQVFAWRRKAIRSGEIVVLTRGSEAETQSFAPVEVAREDGARCGRSGNRHWRCDDPGGERCCSSPSDGGDPGRARGMIPTGAKVYVATRPVDFRKGPDGLAALVRDTGADPFSGALYVFRAKRADRVKIVWWDGSGLCLFAKRLDEDKFRWPRVENGVIRLAAPQLMALVEGMDWTRVRAERRRRPTSLG